MPNNPVPEEVKKIMKKMKDSGQSNNYIAKITGYSRRTVINHTKEEKQDE